MLHSFSIYLLNKGLELLEILSNSTFQRFISTLFSRGLVAPLLAIQNVPFLTSTYCLCEWSFSLPLLLMACEIEAYSVHFW